MHGVMKQVANTPEISVSAIEAFAVMLKELRVPDGDCMRLNLKGGNIFLQLDQPGALDVTFEHDGCVVLTIDEHTSTNCEGRILDYKENERFILRQLPQ